MTLDSSAHKAATSALQAWDLLQERGLERSGRDGDLVDLLHRALQACQGRGADSTFDEVLLSASLEQFIRAFFESATPYVDMLKDILRWFEQADAKKGPHGWRLAWNGTDIPELQHFRELLRELEACTVVIETAAVSFDDCWTLIEHLSKASSARLAREFLLKDDYRSLPKAAQNFAYNYEYRFEALPTSLQGPFDRAWLNDVWNLIRCASSQLDHAGLSGQLKARENARKLNYARTVDDGLAVDSLCMNETDRWLLQLVACASALAESPTDQTLISEDIEGFLSSMARRSFVVEDSIEVLTAFLDLPLWKHRHEFFSAWIASRIIDSCGEHEQELLHDKGVIALPFKRTELARIVTAIPMRTLFSERRSPLSDPKGKGRSNNVQPDFSVWHSTSSGDVCDLVVEVKHYLHPAKKNWAHVIEDYADAHPTATIILLNYGRPGNAMEAVRGELRSRCRIIGDIRPRHSAATTELADLVRRAVGPVFRVAQQGVRAADNTPFAVILDRSSSMRLDLNERIAILKRHVDAFQASHVGVATFGADAFWSVKDEGVDAAANFASNNELRFTEILSSYLKKVPELVFVTDDQGSNCLDRNELAVQELTPAQAGVRVFRIALH